MNKNKEFKVNKAIKYYQKIVYCKSKIKLKKMNKWRLKENIK